MNVIWRIWIVVIVSCTPPPMPPECASSVRDQMEANYVREVREACPSGMPCEALADIEWRYEQAREAWIRCGNE